MVLDIQSIQTYLKKIQLAVQNVNKPFVYMHTDLTSTLIKVYNVYVTKMNE
jgi:hypothetical protein